jgi:putative ABC transport system permease protein
VWLGPPLLAAADHWAQSSVHADRDDLVRRRRSSRGRVLELLLVALGAAAVVEVRLQGVGATQQGSNLLGTIAPILLAALATAVAVRCYPLLLGPAARAAERRGGPASFLGLAGAARSALPLAVPAFVVTLTLTLVALGGLMQQAIGSGRVASSWQALGADAVVTLPYAAPTATAARAVAAIDAVPGVTHATAVATQASTSANETVILVDPASYAAVSADSPWPLGTSLPATGSGSGPVPILVGQNVQEPVGALVTIRPDYAPSIQAKVVGRLTQAPVTAGVAASGSGLVIVPSWGVAANAADWPPNEILVSGDRIDESAMNAALHRTLPAKSTVAYRADLLTGYVHAPLAQLAEFGYLCGLLIAGAFGVCGILISLSLAAPSRRRRLTLLRTLGLTPRQARAIALAETVPLAVVTVIGGLLAAAALPAVFGDSLNLSVFTGQPGATALAFEPGIPLLAALAAVALTVFGVVVQAAVAGRTSAGTLLRMGEDADA